MRRTLPCGSSRVPSCRQACGGNAVSHPRPRAVVRHQPFSPAHTPCQHCVTHRGRPSVVVAAGGADALSDLKRVAKGTSIDPHYLEGAAYLKSLGLVNQAEIARVLDIAMNPKSLFLTYRDYKRAFNASARPLQVESDMKPVVEFLQSKGAQSTEIVRIIVEHPPILSYSVDTRLRPFWEYLESVGLSNVTQTVIKRPSLLGLDADANIRKMVDYLRYIETPEEKIVEYLQTCL